jgi:phytoene dehydrogenase-like protein
VDDSRFVPVNAAADHVAIVGAGLAGLAAALHLTRRGVPVTLYEAGDRVGGQVVTDQVDGFLLDRGFQVHNTAYPEAARLLDEPALRFGEFLRGALLCEPGRRHLVADPRVRPQAAGAVLTAPLGSVRDRVALARLAATALLTPVSRLKKVPETSTEDYLRSVGLSEVTLDRFLRPFLGGVFLESALSTSSRFFLLSWHCFVHGRSVLPAAGIGAIPAQLAAHLPPGTLRLGHRLDALPDDAAAVIVATDTAAAHRFLPELGPAPALTSVTTIYHASDAPPLREAAICLDGTGHPTIANTVVLTNAVPSYAPDGRHLISTSVLAPEASENDVRAALPLFYGDAVADFEHVATVAVGRATPVQPPPLGTLRRPVRVRPGYYVAGAHRDTASTQGALVSGRRAAAAVLSDLHLKETP